MDTVYPSLNRIFLGESAIFKCFHSAEVIWMHNSKKMIPMYLFGSGNIMFFYKVTMKSAGVYTCRTNNQSIGKGILEVNGSFYNNYTHN